MGKLRILSFAVSAVLLVLAAGACSDSGSTVSDAAHGSVPTKAGSYVAPTVRGVLQALDTSGPAEFRLVDASDAYYEGMTVRLLDGATLTAASGDPISRAALSAGSTVDVWVDGGCNESYPVQCDLIGLQVVLP
jgi:hypothetical protein